MLLPCMGSKPKTLNPNATRNSITSDSWFPPVVTTETQWSCWQTLTMGFSPIFGEDFRTMDTSVYLLMHVCQYWIWGIEVLLNPWCCVQRDNACDVEASQVQVCVYSLLLLCIFHHDSTLTRYLLGFWRRALAQKQCICSSSFIKCPQHCHHFHDHAPGMLIAQLL